MGRLSVVLVAVLSLAASLDAQHGFASMNGGTTGGAGGETVYVSTAAKLTAAVTGDTPRIIKITQMITISDWIRPGSNKSILGTTANSGLSGAGIYIRRVRNVIVRGLVLRNPIAPFDAVSIDEATNVWIDHNEFYSDLNSGKDYYDGLCDAKHAADYITISWNKFHDHFKVSLVGHSDNNESEDRGKLRVTYDHNWFYNMGSRLPSLRFGTGHIFNNVFENVESSGINSRMGAQVLVEANSFTNVNKALTTNLDSSQQGFAVERNNLWGGAVPDITQRGNFTNPPYSVTVEGAQAMIAGVKARSGNTIIFP